MALGVWWLTLAVTGPGLFTSTAWLAAWSVPRFVWRVMLGGLSRRDCPAAQR